MLRSLNALLHYKVSATDGDIGKVSDFYFDDAHWVIRYLVADCGDFFSERSVLISPISFAAQNFVEHHFYVGLTRDRVKNSPPVDLAKPVSRQYEREFLQYHGWPTYWGSSGMGLWGAYDYPQIDLSRTSETALYRGDDENDDPHLRSINEVSGYHVQGRDGEIGHVLDFIWDDRTWAIRYLVVDTSNWWTGRHVLVSPHWLTEISWAEKTVRIDLPCELIKFSPQWKQEEAVDRDYEQRLHEYYSRPAYWVEEERRRQEKAHGTSKNEQTSEAR